MTVTFATAADIAAAFHDPALEPPPASASIGHGPTAQLRAAMARFSDRSCHADRRAAVVTLIETLDPAAARTVAFDETSRTLASAHRVDLVADLAFRVPTDTMLALLGVPGDRATLVADVASMVAVIGRGVPASERSDHATERLLAACDGAAGPATSMVSLLYQSHDATAALLVETVVARHHRTSRAPAVLRTARVAVAETTIGDVAVPVGEIVVLDLGAADLEFGAGPHQCPGRSLAEAIVAGIIAAIDTAGFVVREISSTADSNGRPSSVIIGQR